MACFLLPKTLCSDLESIITKFWWQKGHGQRGIHWCTLKELCISKEKGGLGFRSLDQFNIALLANEGWRLINYPISLLAQQNTTQIQISSMHSWGIYLLLPEEVFGQQKDYCKMVYAGDRVSIWNDCWIPSVDINGISNRVNNSEIELVSRLIETTTRRWKRDLIENTFPEHIAQKILQIPLAEEEHEDFQVWREEHSGEFTVRSAYKLLQEATMDPNDLLLQTETKKLLQEIMEFTTSIKNLHHHMAYYMELHSNP
ncbi:ABC transporter C family member 10 [Gossypium australe]|uniref:ABC transporter C family member 10 n=1 Tax=Gossypium australe TaxID=47621 RepID=A0A5B6UY35_9ROSI|nr:ABC transporter C family member 10 [Gossypium australe]